MNTKKNSGLSAALSVAQGLSYLGPNTPGHEEVWNFGVDALSAAEIHRDHGAIAECVVAAAKNLGHTHHSRTVSLLRHVEEQREKHDEKARRAHEEPTRHYPHSRVESGLRDPRGIDVM